MILYSLDQKPSLLEALFSLTISMGVVIVIYWLLYRTVDITPYIKEKFRPYFGIYKAAVMLIAFVFFVVVDLVDIKQGFWVWERYSSGEFYVYKGVPEKIKYSTTGVRYYIGDGLNVFFAHSFSYCGNLATLLRHKDNEVVLIKYISLGKVSEPYGKSKKCAVHVESIES
ncbi:hypothetical protein SAMN03080615_02426 [Amphritea atlantica]|uniref:Uncharacterized protein n=1 Tax=Amphritea atlantica TaxID=355243 RepID=A0A1H9I4J4_9GAMM|nr:hypothetical protein [Amphritea atlantica]SEQ69476.1 hypothetical protein SAMN03080615_02426 [Amphritea atlantica]